MQKLIINSKLILNNKTLEEIKKIRTIICLQDSNIKAINITSAVEKEGKSMMSFWLSNTLAEAGKKVVLIDANLRAPNKNNIFSLDTIKSSINKNAINNEQTDIYSKYQSKSLVAYLDGSAKKEDIILDSENSNLSLILAGKVPSNPSELLSDVLFKELIKYLRLLYDYIIIDTPAVDNVTDSIIIAEQCDACIMVIEPGKVSYDLAKKVKAQIEETKVKLLGVVLNKDY